MAEKKRFVLRINPRHMRALEKWAGDEFRSTNAQLEWLLSRALKEAGRLPKVETGDGDSTDERLNPDPTSPTD